MAMTKQELTKEIARIRSAIDSGQFSRSGQPAPSELALIPGEVQDPSFRAGFSSMDTTPERVQFLRERAGPGGFSVDPGSREDFVLTPQGQKALGEGPGKGLLRIDSPDFTMRDFTDIGLLGEIAGGTVGGMAAPKPGGPLGLLSSALGTGAGTMAGADITERIESALGLPQMESGEEIQARATNAGLIGGAGDLLLGGPARFLGGKLLRPSAGRMNETNRELLREVQEQAGEIGMKAPIAGPTITNAPLQGRALAIADLIFKDSKEVEKAAFIRESVKQFRGRFLKDEQRATLKDIGTATADALDDVRTKFFDEADVLYTKVDESLAVLESSGGSRNIIPTSLVKKRANELVEDLPLNDDGVPIGTDPKMAEFIRDLNQLPDFVSPKAMQALRRRFSAGMRNPADATFGSDFRNARLMHEAANESFKAAEQSAAGAEHRTLIRALRQADDFYREGADKLNQNLVKRILRDSNQAGAIPPEKIMAASFKKDNGTQIGKLMKVLPDDVKDQYRDAAMEELLKNVVKRSDDAVIKDVFSGTSFLNGLDDIGKGSLEATFGKQTTKDLFRLGRVIQLISKKHKGGAGGLIAAEIAVNPISNIGTMAQFRILSKVMRSEFGIKWLTEGFAFPTTEKGFSALQRSSLLMGTLVRDDAEASQRELGAMSAEQLRAKLQGQP